MEKSPDVGQPATMTFLNLTCEGEGEIEFSPRRLIIAGWTGRDRAAMERHMGELEALGVTRPARTPVFYRAAASRLTTAPVLQTTGEGSSGEVEFVLFNIDGDWWVGVGSDHTDRQVEAYNITVSKQMCDKPIAPVIWRYDQVSAHWDDLRIRSFAEIDGERVMYQDGRVAAMLSPADLVQALEDQTGRGFGPGDVMMGGTLAAMGGVRPADGFEVELIDERAGRRISHRYQIETLPVEG